jgi:hypothetical protein
MHRPCSTQSLEPQCSRSTEAPPKLVSSGLMYMQIAVSLVNLIGCLPAHAPVRGHPSRDGVAPGVPVGGHQPRPLARTALRESNYPADPPIDTAEEAAAGGRNEEDTMFGIENMERGFRKNNNAMCQPDSEFVPNCTRVASLCTGPPQFASSCMKLHPPQKFMYVKCN